MWISTKRFRQMENDIKKLMEDRDEVMSRYITSEDTELSRIREAINTHTDILNAVFDIEEEAYIDKVYIKTLVGIFSSGTGEAKIKKTYTLKPECLPRHAKKATKPATKKSKKTKK